MTRRSQRTNDAVQQAFLALLKTQAYETITMSDIARQANCHRTTVHRHYASKKRLLWTCFEVAAEEIKDGLTYPWATSVKSVSQIAYANILVFYNHVANNQTLYRALLTTDASNDIRIRFRRTVAGVALIMMEQDGVLKGMTAPSRIVSSLLGDMIVGAIIWWLESGSDVEPALLAEIVLRMAETGVFGLTGQAVSEEDISFTVFLAE